MPHREFERLGLPVFDEVIVDVEGSQRVFLATTRAAPLRVEITIVAVQLGGCSLENGAAEIGRASFSDSGTVFVDEGGYVLHGLKVGEVVIAIVGCHCKSSRLKTAPAADRGSFLAASAAHCVVKILRLDAFISHVFHNSSWPTFRSNLARALPTYTLKSRPPPASTGGL